MTGRRVTANNWVERDAAVVWHGFTQMSTFDENDPIIVALDFSSAAEADQLVSCLGDSAGFYKVGMELFGAAGRDYVRSLVDRGKQVFAVVRLDARVARMRQPSRGPNSCSTISRSRDHSSGVLMCSVGRAAAIPGHHFERVMRCRGSPNRSLDRVTRASKRRLTAARARTHGGASREPPQTEHELASARFVAPQRSQSRCAPGAGSACGRLRLICSVLAGEPPMQGYASGSCKGRRTFGLPAGGCRPPQLRSSCARRVGRAVVPRHAVAQPTDAVRSGHAPDRAKRSGLATQLRERREAEGPREGGVLRAGSQDPPSLERQSSRARGSVNVTVRTSGHTGSPPRHAPE